MNKHTNQSSLKKYNGIFSDYIIGFAPNTRNTLRDKYSSAKKVLYKSIDLPKKINNCCIESIKVITPRFKENKVQSCKRGHSALKEKNVPEKNVQEGIKKCIFNGIEEKQKLEAELNYLREMNKRLEYEKFELCNENEFIRNTLNMESKKLTSIMGELDGLSKELLIVKKERDELKKLCESKEQTLNNTINILRYSHNNSIDLH